MHPLAPPTDACYDRNRHTEFLRFLKQVANAYPRVKPHVVADNYATHKPPVVKAWLGKNPRISPEPLARAVRPNYVHWVNKSG